MIIHCKRHLISFQVSSRKVVAFMPFLNLNSQFTIFIMYLPISLLLDPITSFLDHHNPPPPVGSDSGLQCFFYYVWYLFFKTCDLDGDGKLNYAEFRRMMFRQKVIKNKLAINRYILKGKGKIRFKGWNISFKIKI